MLSQSGTVVKQVARDWADARLFYIHSGSSVSDEYQDMSQDKYHRFVRNNMTGKMILIL